MFYRLGILPDYCDDPGGRPVAKSSENLESYSSSHLAESLVGRKSSKSYDNLYYCSDDYKLSPQALSVSYGAGDILLSYSMSPRLNFSSSLDIGTNSYKLSPKVFGLPRPLVTQSLEELASPPPPPPPPQLWGSLQDLPSRSLTDTSEVSLFYIIFV